MQSDSQMINRIEEIRNYREKVSKACSYLLGRNRGKREEVWSEINQLAANIVWKIWSKNRILFDCCMFWACYVAANDGKLPLLNTL